LHYWNKAHFECLAELAVELASAPHLEGLAEYCKLRGLGLRKEAFSSLDRFLDEASALPEMERRNAVISLLEAHARAPNAHTLLTWPLMNALIIPTLEGWLKQQEAPAAVHWLGVLQRDAALLRRAIELDQHDLPARRKLIDFALSEVEYATHHLGEGRFIGDTQEAISSLATARSLIATAPFGSKIDDLVVECEQLGSLISDWLSYSKGPDGTFQEWCAARGRSYAFPKAFYYSRGGA
jgi:hypothetical protein